jgi:hypothetical protein
MPVVKRELDLYWEGIRSGRIKRFR